MPSGCRPIGPYLRARPVDVGSAGTKSIEAGFEFSTAMITLFERWAVGQRSWIVPRLPEAVINLGLNLKHRQVHLVE